MSAATHVTVTADTRVDVLPDGRVRMSGDGWSLAVEPATPLDAIRLRVAFDDASLLAAEERRRRLRAVRVVTQTPVPA